jgi:tyrosyl-tRNA synthetase
MLASAQSNLLDELRWRGLLHQTAGEAIERFLQTRGRIGYAGFDPTSDSLTIGNFIPIKMLMHWQRAGHKPIVVMGGGTGLIGDPSGKEEERQLRSRAEIEVNVNSQRAIFERFLDFDPKNPHAAIIVNNIDWLDRVSYIDMLRDVGKHFSVNEMIQRESVKRRLEAREQGISYTEFSYMVLQAYDFLHLYEAHNCTVQIGGSDQYGNIVAGMDLIRRKHGGAPGGGGAQAYGITNPLVTKADGSKIGKTESGAIWLTANRTSPYAFYQYWINTADADAGQFLRWFTMMPREEIDDIMAAHAKSPHAREAQRALARHMTTMVHGQDEMRRTESASAALFSGEIRALDDSLLREVFADVPHSTHDRAALEGAGLSLVELLPQTSLASSKREAREFLTSGAVLVNGEKVPAERALTTRDLLHGRMILLKRGKKNWHATEWV